MLLFSTIVSVLLALTSISAFSIFPRNQDQSTGLQKRLDLRHGWQPTTNRYHVFQDFPKNITCYDDKGEWLASYDNNQTASFTHGAFHIDRKAGYYGSTSLSSIVFLQLNS